ncbi:hypothetical protein BHECKSOX_1006 [Bathymodiolus heckerae thiotrophic gill symbiont]|nr:hypothetical protein BHECKSOX_1006 [Bathymodiolus heckerae thiotrophic gill symbiont]
MFNDLSLDISIIYLRYKCPFLNVLTPYYVIKKTPKQAWVILCLAPPLRGEYPARGINTQPFGWVEVSKCALSVARKYSWGAN